MAVNVYEDFDTESFIINNIKLRVNPTDVTLFADNAVYSETYLRSKAVFSFRSKHAREKVILTLPISISVTDTTNDENAIYSREDGLRLLSQLSNYPFCFIKSSRIKSYVAPLGGVSSTDFLMFGVQQLTVTQDMSVPDVLFLEVHLVFNNFAPLLRDFKFKDFSQVTEYPSQSDMFNQAFAELEGNRKDVDALLEQLQNLLGDSQKSGSAYVDGSLPYGTTVILAPKVSEEEENSLMEHPVDYSTLLSETKVFEITASDGTSTYNADFLSAVDSEEPKKSVVQKKKFKVAWTAPSDLSFGGVAAIQRVKITRYNKLARHFISAHKHPVLQYMGRQPSTVELSYKVNSSDVYKENISSIIAAYSHLFNMLDFNSLTYPEATAYNTLKIRSIAAQAVGLKNIVPNQKHISSTSNEQGVETLNISLIESDIEDFMKISRPILGREVSSTSSANAFKEAVVLTYLDKLAANYSVVTKNLYSDKFLEVYNSEYKEVYATFFKAMGNTYEAILSEFVGGAVGGKETAPGRGYNEIGYINSNFSNLANNFTDNVTITRDMRPVASILASRIRYRNILKKSNSAQKQQIGDKTKAINVEFEGEGTKSVIPADNYKQAGVADNSISVMFEQITKMAQLGDSAAKSSVETHKTDSVNVNNARVTSYSGSNFKEFDLEYLKAEGGGTDPMYFVEPYYHMTHAELQAAYQLVNENYKASVDDVLSSTSSLGEASDISAYNFASPVLTPKNIDEQGYSKEEGTGFHVDAMGNQSEGTDSDDYQGTAGGNYGLVTGGAAAGKFTDWNALTGLSADQQYVKKSIATAVNNSTIVEAKDKASWIVFLTQLSGKESGLTTGAVSPTGPVGPFQFTLGTGQAYGLSSTDRKDPIKATHAALKLLSDVRKGYLKDGYTDWIDPYFGFNLGEAPGRNLLSAIKKGTDLGDKTKKQIIRQNIAGISESMPKKDIARLYYNHMISTFAPMNKHMNVGAAPKTVEKVEANAGVKKETTPKTVTREDIAKSFVKVTYLDKPELGPLAHSFFVAYNGKQYKIQIRDMNSPFPPIQNCRMTMKDSNREVLYTRKAQPFGTDALNKIKELTKGGFYVEKAALTAKGFGVSAAYDLNYKDICKLMVEYGLSFPQPGSPYANIKSNFYLGKTKQDYPSAYDAKYLALAKKYSEGDKSVRFT